MHWFNDEPTASITQFAGGFQVHSENVMFTRVPMDQYSLAAMLFNHNWLNSIAAPVPVAS